MEPFKIALKIAIDQQADKISFVEGRLPVMRKDDKEIAINHQPIVQKILLSQLFASFFPGNQEKLTAGQPVQGPLKVVDVGDLILLAIPGNPSALNVYFPGAGEQYFADDWRSLARMRGGEPMIDIPVSAEAAPEASAVPPPPPPMATGRSEAPAPVEPPVPSAPQAFAPDAVAPEAVAQNAVAPEAVAQYAVAPEAEAQNAEPPAGSIPLPAAYGESAAPSAPVANKAPAADKALVAEEGENGHQHSAAEDDQDKLGTTSDPNIPFSHSQLSTGHVFGNGEPYRKRIDNSGETAQDFSSLEVSQLRPVPKNTLVSDPAAVAQSDPYPSPIETIAIGGKDIRGLMGIMATEGFDQLVLSSGQKAAFSRRGHISLSDTPMTPEGIGEALETLLPEAHKTKEEVAFGWYKTEGPQGYRVQGCCSHSQPWLSIVKKTDPLSQSAKELLIPEGITDLAWLDRGLVILAGEQSSGKSTTVHHLVDRINRHRSRNVLLIQDEDIAGHQPERSSIRTDRLACPSASPIDRDPANTLVVDVGFRRDVVEPVLAAANQGKLVFWVLPGQTGGEAMFDILRYLEGTQQPFLAAKLISRLTAIVSQTILTSADHLPVPLFEAWRLSDRHRGWLKQQWRHNLADGETALYQLVAPSAAAGISFEQSILSALTIGAITPLEVRQQFFDKDRIDTLFAEAGISSLSSAGELLDGNNLEAS